MGYPYLISDKVTDVNMKLGNRQDLLKPAPGSTNTYSRIAGWLRDAYISISYGNTFEQTEDSFNFQTVPGQDTYAYPVTVRACKAFNGYWTTTQPGAPIQCDYKDINYIRRYNNPTNENSVPSIWTMFGNSIILRPVPGGVFNFIMDNWMKPVITPTVVTTPLLMPDDWLEVLCDEAAVRGHAELLERDKARELQSLLYGFVDPNTGKFTPGIVDKLGNRRQAQAPYIDYGIQPKYKQNYGRRR